MFCDFDAIKKVITSLIKLAVPIIIGQLGQMLIVAGDVFMAGKYATQSVAAIGVASGFINPIMYFGIGLTIGVSPLIAIKRGEGEVRPNAFLSILFYGLVIGLCLTIILLGQNFYIRLAHINPKLIPSIKDYIEIIAWSMPFAIAFQAIKEYLQGFEKVVIPNLIAILSVVLNLILNYFFIFGIGEFKGFGEIGLAYASFAIRFLMFVAILFYVAVKFKFGKFNYQFIKENFLFSLPISFMFFLEVLAFCIVSILSGRLDVVSAATNNLIMTIASVTFMIPLSFANATAVKVGHAFGNKQHGVLMDYVKGSLICVLCFIGISLSTYLLLPSIIMRMFTEDTAVIELGIKVLFIVGLFQFSDGMQVLLSGILRGLEDTKLSSFLVFLGYWIIGIPLGVYLTFYKKIGIEGLWVGLAMALTIVATTLGVYTQRKLKILRYKFNETI